MTSDDWKAELAEQLVSVKNDMDQKFAMALQIIEIGESQDKAFKQLGLFTTLISDDFQRLLRHLAPPDKPSPSTTA